MGCSITEVIMMYTMRDVNKLRMKGLTKAEALEIIIKQAFETKAELAMQVKKAYTKVKRGDL